MQPFLFANLLHDLFTDGLHLYGGTRINLCPIELNVLQHIRPFRGKHHFRFFFFLDKQRETEIWKKDSHEDPREYLRYTFIGKK